MALLSTGTSSSTVFVPFNVSDTTPWMYSFSAITLDGKVANCTLQSVYNQFSQRYYLSCTSAATGLIFLVPMIDSPDDVGISLSAGYLQTQIVYRASTQNLEIT